MASRAVFDGLMCSVENSARVKCRNRIGQDYTDGTKEIRSDCY
jgi:hypothetical protein